MLCIFASLLLGIKQKGIELPYIRTNFAYINGLYRIFEYHFIKVVPLSFTVLKLLTTFFFLSTIKTGLFYFILYQRQFSKRIVNKIVNNGEGKKIGEWISEKLNSVYMQDEMCLSAILQSIVLFLWRLKPVIVILKTGVNLVRREKIGRMTNLEIWSHRRLELKWKDKVVFLSTKNFSEKILTNILLLLLLFEQSF